MLDRVTITGADDAVDVEALRDLTLEFSFVEWGLLLSESRMGTPRYPTWNWLRKFFEMKADFASHGKPWKVQTSGHLCGKWVRDIENEGRFTIVDLLSENDCWATPAAYKRRPMNYWDRFQINWGGRGAKVNKDNLKNAYASLVEDKPSAAFLQFILQCPNGDCRSLDDIRRHLAHLNFDAVPLFDSSGGKGIVRENWPQPWTPFSGYAGGLDPENVGPEYRKIAQQAGAARIWIDVESGIRDGDNQFDLTKVRSFLQQITPYVWA